MPIAPKAHFRWRWIVEPAIMCRQRKCCRSNMVFEPMIVESPCEGKSHNVLVESSHRIEMASEYD